MDSIKLIFASAIATLVLSACGGGGHSYGGGSTSPPTTPQTDAFTASVQSLVATAPEDTEPQSTDNTAVTSVDDKEPTAG